ncbi:MAG TPA: molybdopterin-dependent oxidoreductase, partial [Thermoleophilia bacterium]|nr:molybdopterin-dependent oxidoreductase [Thermoleophilia bacterium]
RERARDFTPEKVSNICWIPKEDVITAARMWAIDTPGTIQVGSSLERQANCGHTLRAITCLMGLTGNIERPGSMVSWVLPDTGLIEDFNLELPITDEMKSKIIGGDRFKMGATRTCNPDTMVKKLLAGEAPIKVWFSVGGQQIVHMANTNEVVAAIEKVEFMTHTDLFMGPMAEAADIVLPAAHWLELDDVYDMHPRFMIEAHNKVVDPPGEAKSDAWIFNEVGRRVVPDKWWPTVDDMLDYQIRRGKAPDGGPLKWKDFSERLVSGCWGPDQVYYKYKTDFWREGGGFPTPTGKFEFWSKHLESLGYDPLPVFSEPGESPYSTPDLYKEYPIVMSSGYRQPFYFLGQYRNIPWLRSFMEFPTCQMHPETCAQYGVEDGDIIWIESPRGRIRQKLRAFPGIKKGVLMATANCFYPEEPARGYHGVYISNPNVLTSNNHLDPMYGSPDLTCLLCKVYKAKDEELTEEVFRSEEYGFVPTSGMQDV